MAEMKRAIVRERETRAEAMQEPNRMKSTLVIAAAIHRGSPARARDPDISRPPSLTAIMTDSISLAELILGKIR